MKFARNVSAGILGLVLMVSVIIGAQENFSDRLPAAAHSVEVVQGPSGLQVLYILDSSAGKIAVYQFDPIRQNLKLCSVTPLERKGNRLEAPTSATIRALQKGKAAYVYVLDQKTGKLAVYRHDLSSTTLVLMAVRDWATDMQLDYYNAGPDGRDLTPDMIRDSLPRQR